MVNKNSPPQASVLEACERAMCAALHSANEARRAKDTTTEAKWLARLAWWTNEAAQRLTEVA